MMDEILKEKIDPVIDKSLLINFLALLIATVILSSAAILTKIIEFDLGPSATVFNRYWVAVVTFSLWEVSKFIGQRETEPECKQPIIFTMKDGVLFATESIMSFACISLWAISLTQTSVANANLLHNMTPIFSTLGGWLLLKQKFDGRFLIGLGIALFASSCIEFEDWLTSPSNFSGDILALLSSAFYGGGFLARESLRNKYSASTILLVSCFSRTILALGFALIQEDHLFPLMQSTWLSVLALGIVVQFLGHGFLTYSLKHFSSSFVTLCLLLDPLLTAIFAWIIFAEKLTLLNMLSLVGVLIGIYLASLGQGSQKADAQEIQ